MIKERSDPKLIKMLNVMMALVIVVLFTITIVILSYRVEQAGDVEEGV